MFDTLRDWLLGVVAGIGWWWGTALLLIGVRAFYVFKLGLKDPAGAAFAEYRQQLQGDPWTGVYHRALERGFLRWRHAGTRAAAEPA